MRPGQPYPHRTPEAMLDYLRTHAYRDGDCMLWAGATWGGGYPRVCWRGKHWQAKRLLATLSGRVPSAKQAVYSSCGNRACMADDHLRIGSRAQVFASATKTGGNPKGVHRSLAIAKSRAKFARMGYRAAPEVFRMLDAGRSHQEIADLFGVHKSNINKQMACWARMGITPMTTRLSA